MASTPAGKKPASTPAKSPAARKKAAGIAASTSKRPKIDWEAVERDYRTGRFTLRELETKHGVVNTTIMRRAKREGWAQDLTEAIRQATNTQLVQQLVQQECSNAQQSTTETVLAAAALSAQVIMGHRVGLQRITRIKEVLLDQIEQAAQNLPSLAEVIEMVRQPDENGIDRANDALRKAMSRTALVDDLKKLAEVDEKVRKGEREAFNIAPADGTDPAGAEPKRKRVTIEFVDVVPK